MQITVRTTAEELFNENETISADADIAVTFDAWPEEKATRDYPGCPAGFELIGWEVERYTLYDQDSGEQIEEGPQDRTPKWLMVELDGWINDHDQLLIDQASEEAADAEEAAREAYWESRSEY